LEQRSLLRLLSLIYPEMLKYVLVLPLIISFPGFGFATEYTWTLPSGATVTSSGPSVTVNYSGIAPGDYQICVTGTNECDPVGQNLCW
jgi:hypothetical protein